MNRHIIIVIDGDTNKNTAGAATAALPHCRCWGSNPYKMLPQLSNQFGPDLTCLNCTKFGQLIIRNTLMLLPPDVIF